MRTAILSALPPDIKRTYDVFFRSFQDDKMGSIMLDILFPNGITDEFREIHARETAKFWHINKDQYTLKAVDMATADIVGMELLDIYLNERSDEERKYLGIPWLEGEALERANAVIGALWEAHERILGGRRHICMSEAELHVCSEILTTMLRQDLNVVAVDPKKQGLGIGAQLIGWAIKFSNETGLPIYLEASPSSYPLYCKMGFETLPEKVNHKAEVLDTPSDVEVPLMAYMPSDASGLTFTEWRRRGFPSFEGEGKAGVTVNGS